MKTLKNVSDVAVKLMGLTNKVLLTERARKIGLNPLDVHEAYGHPDPCQRDFEKAREEGDAEALWALFSKSQKGSAFAKKVLREILRRLNGPSDVPKMWEVYHMSSRECDLTEEVLHKINISTSLLHNWMDVIRYSRSGADVHEEAVRLARMVTSSRDVLWTLFRSTENYNLRQSILAKILALSASKSELLQVLSVTEHGYPEIRNRCLRRIVDLPEAKARKAKHKSEAAAENAS